ncbi:MAG: hypothetical protein V1794_18590, partial [Candidatus Glassbacteria bacterium]
MGKALLILLAAALAVPAAVSARRPGDSGKKKLSPYSPDLAVISRMFTTTNNIIFGVDNRGNLGKDPGGSSTTGGGFWRSRTDQYVFQSGLHVAGLFDSNRDGALEDTVETEAVYDEEWREGKASNSQDAPENRLYTSKNSADLDAWPVEFRDENGDPKVFGQEDIVTFYTDIGGPVNVAAGSKRLGVETYQRVKLFSVTSQKDIMYVEWRFKNATEYINEDVNGDGTPDVVGPYEIKNMLAIINTDFDIGEAQDDRAGVSPLYNMSIMWDSDFGEANFVNPVGFLGIKFLDSPTQVGRPNDGVDNNDNGQVDEAGEANRIGLSGFTITTNRGGPREDPNTDKEAYRIMVNAPGEVTEPQWDPDADLIISDFQDDLRARLLTGPFDLPADGSFQKVEVGYLLAEPLRSPADPDDITLSGELVNLVGLAQTVQTTFDTDFNLPAPPVGPNMQLVERDGVIIVTWDDLPEKTSDPFYPVSQVATNPDGTPAATYNPDYLEYDFQGYRVYRSLTTNPGDARLVGQYDKADGISSTSASYLIQQGVDVNGDGVPDFSDTTFDPFEVGFGVDDNVKDAGLRYIFVDRGQGLSNREGLINGIKYYYSVTAFDYQPSNTGQESLESGLQFISLDQTGRNQREGVPRTSANGYFPPSVGDITQEYPDDSPVGDPVTINLGANGLIDGTTPQPASDGLVITNVTIANGDASVLPTGLTLMVDSVTNIFDDFDASLGIYHDAQFEVHLHAEDGAGRVMGATKLGSMPLWDPFGGSVELEGSLPIKSATGETIASIDFTVFADNWNGLVIEPIQVSGNIQYDNIAQPRQRTHMTQYFWWLYGWGNYSGAYGLSDADVMPTIASDPFQVGHIVAGVRVADIELKWVADGSDLTIQATDLSNKVPVRFNQLPNDGWGFVPKDKTPLDIMIDHQTAHNTFDVFWGTADPGEDLIATEMTLADGSTQPYATDDGIRRNLFLVNKLSQAIKPSDYDVAGHQLIDEETGEVADEIGDHVADLTGTQDLDLYVCGVIYKINGITRPPAAGDTWKIRMRWHPSAAQNPYRGGTAFPGPAEYAHRRPVAGNKWAIALTPETVDLAARDLKRIKVVPNPYIASSPLDLTTTDINLRFVNLPGVCTIRIYTVAGHLVDVIEH